MADPAVFSSTVFSPTVFATDGGAAFFASIAGDLHDNKIDDPLLTVDPTPDAFLNDLVTDAYYPAGVPVIRRFGIPIDPLGAVARKFSLPIETLTGVARRFGIPIESAGFINRRFGIPIDSLGITTRRFTLPVESGGRNPLELPVFWDVLNRLSTPLPIIWGVVGGGPFAMLPVQFAIKATITPLGVEWRVVPNVMPLFSQDVQQPSADVTETS